MRRLIPPVCDMGRVFRPHTSRHAGLTRLAALSRPHQIVRCGDEVEIGHPMSTSTHLASLAIRLVVGAKATLSGAPSVRSELQLTLVAANTAGENRKAH